jgi:hypothetical protein
MVLNIVITLINIELYVMKLQIYLVCFFLPSLCFFSAFVYTSLTDFTAMDLTEDQLASQMPLEDYGYFFKIVHSICCCNL